MARICASKPARQTRLSGLQKKLNLYRLKGKDDPPTLCTVDNAGINQGCDIAMDCLYITFNAPRRFPDRYRPGAAKRLKQLPSLRG